MRELGEEVGVSAEILGFVDHVQPIHRDKERVRTHFVIAVLAARWTGGEPGLSEEADDVVWIDPADASNWRTTPELPRLIAKAAELFGSRA